jgi:hypothetical protein
MQSDPEFTHEPIHFKLLRLHLQHKLNDIKQVLIRSIKS